MKIYNTRLYDKWFSKLRDNVAKLKIDARIWRIKLYKDFGDCEKVSKNVSELKINHGPGYRIYLTIKEEKVIILLIGGDKSSQARDIKKAEKMASYVLIEEVEEWY